MGDDAAEDMPYLQSGNTDPTWAAKALESAAAGRLHVHVKKVKGSRLLIRATGECPRCLHDVDFEFIETIVGPMATASPTVADGSPIEARPPSLGGVLGGGAEFVDADVLCWCEQKHPGRPAGGRGCGVGFSIGVLQS